jgi:Taurine catabolism dioxygenase TauD, TfdA family
MLTHREDLAISIGRFVLPNIWQDTYQKVESVLADLYGNQDCTKFSLAIDQQLLARAILSIPSLSELQQQIRELQQTGYHALLINQLGLRSFAPLVRNKLLLAISLVLGYPTPTDPQQGQLLWDIKQRQLPPGHLATFSEHSDRAELHTDTQYYPQPENYFLLYAVQAAKCGGGKSLLCDGQEIQACLLATAEGRAAWEMLSSFPFPFRIPTTFTHGGQINAIETTLAPIFGITPLIRFRRDTLEKGFQARPDLDIPEARAALRVLNHVLENKVNVISYPLQDDDLLICNNHTTLHGRTTYLDRDRYFIRVRMGNQPFRLPIQSPLPITPVQAVV